MAEPVRLDTPAQVSVLYQVTCKLAGLNSTGGVEGSHESTQAQNKIYLPSMQPLREAFWRTLIGDAYSQSTRCFERVERIVEKVQADMK
jgi:hypothetical protein